MVACIDLECGFVAVGLAAVVMVLSARGDTPESYSQIKAARTRRLELLQRRGDLEHRRTLLNPAIAGRSRFPRPNQRHQFVGGGKAVASSGRSDRRGDVAATAVAWHRHG